MEGLANAQPVAAPSANAPEASSAAPVIPSDGSEPARNKPFGLSFGLQGGLTYFAESGPFGTDTGIGQALAPGYNLGLRASFELYPWLAVDARGLLLHNDGNAYVAFGSFTTYGGFGAARFTLPVPHVRPYALLGFGGYRLAASGAQTQLVSDSVGSFVAGLGAVVPTGRGFEVGVEYLFNYLVGETLSINPNADGGDPGTLSLFAQYRLPL
jgi:hypothetical protein